ncbi:DUF4012 domain-containing protein [uncultured Microbacterium sp.]|uniref:DUF4012 domain-containing protein n=1 Tax=uncultured Microbacterium sp. TaxID=191216 RepID=UPI0025ED2269|nr:DUF4012 domain-containing protein [uncultured Microbacterium sp.]
MIKRATSGRRPRRVRSALVWAVYLALAAGVVTTVWVGGRAALAVEHLRSAQATVSAAARSSDDPAAAIALLGPVGADAAAARSLTSDPIWRLAEMSPWVGPQLRAIARTAAATDDAVTGGIAPLASVAGDLAPRALQSAGGVVDVARLASAHPAVAVAAEALGRSADEVREIDSGPLLGRLSNAVAHAADALGTAADRADSLARATALAPRMLGDDGPRSTLVLFQNNAEWRSLGGVVGAVAQIDADSGRISLSAQGSSGDFASLSAEPVAPLPADVQSIYDTRPARFIQNVTQVPDFTVGAPLAREMWRRVHGAEVDAVVALDPVTLSYLLRATGPVLLPSGDVLTADSAVPLLLQDVYARYADPNAQDAFFQAASVAVFQAVTEGRADPAALVDALARASAERRLLIWNADADTQSILDGTPAQGTLPVSDATRSTVAVYLDDGTGSKMDYYLHPRVETAWCSTGTASVHVDLRSDAPDPAALPPYVTGAGVYGVTPGHALTGVYVYLPPGASVIDQQTSSDASVTSGFAGGSHGGRPVVKWSVDLPPGAQASLDLEVSLPAAPVLDAVMTPTRDPDEVPTTGVCRFPNDEG